MMRGLLVFGLVLTISSAGHADDQATAKLPAPPTNAATEKLKKLAGTWFVADKDGKPPNKNCVGDQGDGAGQRGS
jgi:hypothetical protein